MRILRVDLASLVVALVLAGVGACRSGDAWEVVVDPLLATEEATLLPSGDREAYDRFGQSVALSADGTWALVAAPTDHNGGDLYAGSVHAFLRTGMTWSEEAVLLGGQGDFFGQSVALSSDGSRALIGAQDYQSGLSPGKVHVLLRTGTTWSEEATLVAPDRAAYDRFGLLVALSSDGSRALVSARAAIAAGPIVTSAHVFLRTGTTWAAEATPLAVGLSSLALSSDGSRALVGTPSAAVDGVNTGSARVFLRTGTSWTEEATLLAADREAEDGFGTSVALSSDGSRALVGATRDETGGGVRGGSARVFLRTGKGWIEEATLFAVDAPDRFFGPYFGFAVALSSDGSRALVGMHGDDTAGGVNAGSVRVFQRGGTSWIQEAKLTAADGAASDALGFAVALSSDGSRALVGAHGRDSEAGRAHVFTLAPDASTGAAGAGVTGGATGAGGTGGAAGAAGGGGTTGDTGGTTGTAGSGGRDGDTDAEDAGDDGGIDDPTTGSGGCGCDCRVSSGAPVPMPLPLLGVGLILASRRRRGRARVG